jgi:hypothetical protein
VLFLAPCFSRWVEAETQLSSRLQPDFSDWALALLVDAQWLKPTARSALKACSTEYSETSTHLLKQGARKSMLKQAKQLHSVRLGSGEKVYSLAMHSVINNATSGNIIRHFLKDDAVS